MRNMQGGVGGKGGPMTFGEVRQNYLMEVMLRQTSMM